VKTFESVDEVMAAVGKLRDELESCGETEASRELSGALGAFYTTATEALAEVYDALQRTEERWSKPLSRGYVALGEHSMKEARRLMNLG